MTLESAALSVFDEPKVDAHCHVQDPARFAYADDVAYRPSAQEIAPYHQYAQVMDAYGIQRSLFVGPNSGYNLDNRCLLNTMQRGGGQPRGIAVVRNDATLDELRALQAHGVIGVALNATVQGVPHVLASAGLMTRCAEIDFFVTVQAEHERWLDLQSVLEACPARLMVEHCGRPRAGAGTDQPGFQAVLKLSRGAHRSGRTLVKLSGYQKFSAQAAPWNDAVPYVNALIDAYTLDACVWATDWPFLRAPERLDVGPLIRWVERLLPQREDRTRLWWTSPNRWFGFNSG